MNPADGMLTPIAREHAMVEVKETGAVSDELMIALLDAQGERGIYENPERLEELRTALTNKIKEHILIREFPVPDDIEPITGFHR
jgi:hypothetical protein